MKYKSIAILMFCVSLAATVLARSDDEEITSTGTPNFIAKFSGKHRVSTSTIFQSPHGNVGFGTTTPLFPLHVFSNNTLPPPGQDYPVALFVETPASLNTGPCPNCAIIGIEGLASAGSGNVIGVDGVTFSSAGNGVVGNFTSANSEGGGGVIGLSGRRQQRADSRMVRVAMPLVRADR